MEVTDNSFDYLIDYDPEPDLFTKEFESEFESDINEVDSLSVQFDDPSDNNVTVTSSDDELNLDILTSLNGEDLNEMDVIDLELISDLVKKLLEQQEALEDDYVSSEVLLIISHL